MANHTLKKLQYDGSDVQAESAVRDGNGNVIASTYVKTVNNVSPTNGNVTLTIPSAVTETTVSGWGFTKNAGTVVGSSLTANYFVLGNGTTNVKISSLKPTTSSTTWSTSSDVNVPTMKAISSYVTGLGYTSNSGTITGVSVNGTSVATSGVANITSIPWSIVSGKPTIPAAITITTTSGSQSVSDGTNTLTFGSNAFNSTAIPTSYVSSVNGSTGAITNIATTNDLGNYVKKGNANSVTATTTINSTVPAVFTLNRKTSNAGAFIDYFGNNQTTNGWRVGAGGGGSFEIYSQSSGTNTIKMSLNTSGNMTVSGTISEAGTTLSNKYLGKTANAAGVQYLTTAPSSTNTDGGLKIVVLSSEPATKYAGYIYLITEA